MASHFLLLVQPLLFGVVDKKSVDRYINLLEDPAAIESLIERIERKAKVMVSQLGLALLLFLLVILLLTLLVYRRQRVPALRHIAAFEALPDQTDRATESGQTLHVSLGTGGIGGSDTVSSLAGLSVLAHLADQGVAADTPPLVTVSSPTLLPLAQNALRQAYTRRGRREDFRWTQVRLVSPSPMAYALGTMDILNHEPVLANVMFGSFGPEVGLIARAGAESDLIQITGSDDPAAPSHPLHEHR